MATQSGSSRTQLAGTAAGRDGPFVAPPVQCPWQQALELASMSHSVTAIQRPSSGAPVARTIDDDTPMSCAGDAVGRQGLRHACQGRSRCVEHRCHLGTDQPWAAVAAIPRTHCIASSTARRTGGLARQNALLTWGAACDAVALIPEPGPHLADAHALFAPGLLAV